MLLPGCRQCKVRVIYAAGRPSVSTRLTAHWLARRMSLLDLATSYCWLAAQMSAGSLRHGTAFNGMQPGRSCSSRCFRCRQSQSPHSCRPRQLCWRQQRWQHCQQPGPRSGEGARLHFCMSTFGICSSGDTISANARCVLSDASVALDLPVACLFARGAMAAGEQQSASSCCSGCSWPWQAACAANRGPRASVPPEQRRLRAAAAEDHQFRPQQQGVACW